MDLTSDPPTVGRRRGRHVYTDDDPDADCTGDEQLPISPQRQRIMPPSQMKMASRYEVLWTPVDQGIKGSTLAVSLDVPSHFLVGEVIALGVREMQAFVNGRSLEKEKWELRFAGRDRLPRFDYPALDPAQQLHKVACMNQVCLLSLDSRERAALEKEEDKVIVPTQNRLPQDKGSMSTADSNSQCEGLNNTTLNDSKSKCGCFSSLFKRKAKNKDLDAPLLKNIGK